MCAPSPKNLPSGASLAGSSEEPSMTLTILDPRTGKPVTITISGK
jgi:hypothetical protein